MGSLVELGGLPDLCSKYTAEKRKEILSTMSKKAREEQKKLEVAFCLWRLRDRKRERRRRRSESSRN